MSGTTEHVTLRLSTELLVDLRAEMAREQRSLAWVISRRCRDGKLPEIEQFLSNVAVLGSGSLLIEEESNGKTALSKPAGTAVVRKGRILGSTSAAMETGDMPRVSEKVR